MELLLACEARTRDENYKSLKMQYLIHRVKEAKQDITTIQMIDGDAFLINSSTGNLI